MEAQWSSPSTVGDRRRERDCPSERPADCSAERGAARKACRASRILEHSPHRPRARARRDAGDGPEVSLPALTPAARAELLHVLRLPDFDRPESIGEFLGHPETRTFGELRIDLTKDKAARLNLVLA
jgi:hypothetical protein